MKRELLLFAFIGLLFTGTVCAQDGNKQEESEAEVTIIKYSDYQCPYCQYFVPIEEKLEEEYGSRINIVTKHFPLKMHQYAQLASRAAEAAREQGKYEEMHKLIFAGQEEWARGNAEGFFIGYAKSLDLNMDQFREDLNSAEMQRKIMADKREGLEKSVNATPTFFINGIKIEKIPRSYEAFKAIIDDYLAQSES